MTHDAHIAINKRVCELNADMLERRKALNAEHYYPRLEAIQADCAKLGHVRGQLRHGSFGEWYECGYCGATMERHSYLDEMASDGSGT